MKLTIARKGVVQLLNLRLLPQPMAKRQKIEVKAGLLSQKARGPKSGPGIRAAGLLQIGRSLIGFTEIPDPEIRRPGRQSSQSPNRAAVRASANAEVYPQISKEMHLASPIRLSGIFLLNNLLMINATRSLQMVVPASKIVAPLISRARINLAEMVARGVIRNDAVARAVAVVVRVKGNSHSALLNQDRIDQSKSVVNVPSVQVNSAVNKVATIAVTVVHNLAGQDKVSLPVIAISSDLIERSMLRWTLARIIAAYWWQNLMVRLFGWWILSPALCDWERGCHRRDASAMKRKSGQSQR
jgi:hypothetical protein